MSLVLNSVQQENNSALAKKPVYVAQIFFNKGNAGVEGINDIYFATCDVNDITGFAYPARWFPFLKADSIGSLSQTVDPINGVSTIGSFNITITDFNNLVSGIIKAADTAGHGLRRQRVAIYLLYKGMAWADRGAPIRTMQVNDLRLTALNEYQLSAADVQRQLQKTIFNPFSTTLSAGITTTGAITVSVVDDRNFVAVDSVTYGTVGFIQIDDEIMRWTAKANASPGSFTVGAADRGLFGSVATTHAIDAAVGEVVVLNENPVTMMLKIIESSGVALANGAWDAYPAHWGCNMDSTNDIDEAGMLQIGQLVTGLSATPAATDGRQFEFVIAKGVEAKKFIEDSILKIIGCYGFARGDGRYSVRAYNDLANAAKENASIVLDQNVVTKWGDLTYQYNDLANQLWIEYDEAVKLSGKYQRNALFIDSVSIGKWGAAKQLKYSVPGIIPTSGSTSQLYQLFQRVMARYSRPPMKITLTLLPKGRTVEIGDIGRVTLPIMDLASGASLDRAFEILSTQLLPKTGEIQVECIAQPEFASYWFQGVGVIASLVVSPGIANIPTGSTLQMVARTFDASGNQVPTPAINWLATGNITVSSTGLVTAGVSGSGTVYAVSGSQISNIANITVTAAPNTNAVASVSVVPSTATLKAGDTQQFTALAYDAMGDMVNGVTFNWASSNPAVATIPAGSDVTKLLTAVANGTTNITATETASSIVSPVAAITVATPVTPTYTPPVLADSAYQIGTQIATMGPVGGPHVIPDGHDFASGDYWFDGDVSLATGTSCTINGTVRIFSLGVITINGTVDGVGRGVAGAVAVSGIAGVAGTIPGFVGYGGNGGGDGGLAPLEPGAVPLNPAIPSLSIIGSSATEPYTSVSGLPTVLHGSQAACGSSYEYFRNSLGATWLTYQGGGGNGGNSGAGLLFMARGIYVTNGSINLNGLNGGNGLDAGAGLPYIIWGLAGGGGGGDGGSFVALAERDINGLPVMSILQTKINVAGGAQGANLNNNTSSTPATPGGTGAIINQVIG